MDKTNSIDKILLDKELITPEQLTQALQYQCRLPSSQAMSLAEVLVAMEFVTQQQLNMALGELEINEDLLVQMLVKNGLVQEQELQQAVEARQSQHADKRLGTMLLEMGYTTKQTIESALTQYYLEQHTTPGLTQFGTQVVEDELTLAEPIADESHLEASPDGAEPEHEPLGHRLIRLGYINQDELQDAIDYQQRLPRILHKPIGEILVTLGYLNQEELDEVLGQQPARQQFSLGEILVQGKVIQQWQLSHAMSVKEQVGHQDKKLGSLLVELGYAKRSEIEDALKAYYARQQSKKT